MEVTTGETEKIELPVENPHTHALGKLGGLKGGKARAESLTVDERKSSARKAAEARWSKKR